MSDPAGPLAGMTVLEVGVFMAAPYATMQLADLGARVIKVENPAAPDPVRTTGPFLEGQSSPFARLNRNKESVALDLKSPAGRAAFLRLAAAADAVVENLRPGAMRGLGLDYPAVSEVNPGIVYASGSGWGQDGPLATLPGLDIMAQARGGLMSITGTPEGDPVKIGVPVCDLVCGLYLALGVVAALRERDRTGRGPVPRRLAVRVRGVAGGLGGGKYFATGEVGRPLGSAHQNQAPYQAVRSADGWVTIGAITPRTWAGFCAALGPRRAARRRAVRGRVPPPRPPGRADRGIEAVDHHAAHRRDRRAARRRRRAVRPDRRLRGGVHRRAPARPGLLLGRRRTRCWGRCASSGRRCGCPRHPPAGTARGRSSGPTPGRRCWRRATRRRRSTSWSPRAWPRRADGRVGEE